MCEVFRLSSTSHCEHCVCVCALCEVFRLSFTWHFVHAHACWSTLCNVLLLHHWTLWASPHIGHFSTTLVNAERWSCKEISLIELHKIIYLLVKCTSFVSLNTGELYGLFYIPISSNSLSGHFSKVLANVQRKKYWNCPVILIQNKVGRIHDV